MESLKTKNQVLKTEKEKEIAKHEDELAEVVDKHSRDMQDSGAFVAAWEAALAKIL